VRGRRAEMVGMEIQAAAAMSILSMTVQGAHAAIERANANPLPANASPAQHADVILSLSAAAQNLVSPR